MGWVPLLPVVGGESRLCRSAPELWVGLVSVMVGGPSRDLLLLPGCWALNLMGLVLVFLRCVYVLPDTDRADIPWKFDIGLPKV